MSNLCLCLDNPQVAVAPAEIPHTGAQATPTALGEEKIDMSTDQLSHQPPLVYEANPAQYKLVKFIGKSNGGFSKLFVASHNLSSTAVLVKQTDIDDQNDEQLDLLKYEVQLLRHLSHPNILSLHCAFVKRQQLWTVLPFMTYGSASDLVKMCFPDGMPEVLIAYLLKETLQGLDYIHNLGFIHRSIKGSHILVGLDGRVCLVGMRKSIYLPRGYDKPKVAHDFPSHAVHALPWMAPEILQQGYDYKADVYSIGITCIELAHGMVPYTGLEPTEVLLEKLNGLQSPRLSDTYTVPPEMDCNTLTTATDSGLGCSMAMSTDNREPAPVENIRKFSTTFHQVVDLCLKRKQDQRPSVNALLSHSFFKQVVDLCLKRKQDQRPSVNALLSHSFFKQAKRKTKETLPELLSSVFPVTEFGNGTSIDQDADTATTADTLASMTLDEWVF